MKINFKLFLFVYALMILSPCFAQVNSKNSGGLSQGENLFKENKPSEAVEVLEYEILNGQISDNSYNFLGLGYYQIGDLEKSIEAFKRGIKAQPDNKKILSYNLGNSYYAVKNYGAAIECYSDSLKADPLFYEAILNRANALLMAERYGAAKEDYELYIKKCPDDVQRERIELLLKALEGEISRRENEARLLAEQNKPQWEEFDGNLSDKKKEGYKADWEMLAKEEAPSCEEKKSEAAVTTDSEEAADTWQNLSDEELDEMSRLASESRAERERWLSEKKRKEEEQAALELELQKRQQQKSNDEERKMREQLLEDMMKAEEERRRKLLEDVAKSLQNTDSTTQTSGAEDLLEYDLEGELD